MKTENYQTENMQRLDALESKIKEYKNDFYFLRIEKDILANRIINLKNKISNLELNQE